MSDTAPDSQLDGLRTQEVPVGSLRLSKDVPQFKSDADEETGVVEPLAGKYQRLGTGPILVWERLDGRREVISGRHRFDLAKRTGEQTIPAQVVREADGFTVQMAVTADAELNIRDGHGKTKDFANYFRASGTTDTEAESRGLLARAAGKAGWSIGTQGSQELFDLHQNGRLTDAQAAAVARTAPGNEALQRAGIAALNRGTPIDVTVNLMRALELQTGPAPTADQLDLFGADDSMMLRMEEQAKKATEIQRGLKEQVAAVQGAAKRPEQARKLGVNVKDPDGVRKRVEELKALLYRWESWPLHADLRAQVTGETQAPAMQLESVSAEQLAEEQRQREQRARLDAGQAAPLTGTAGEYGTPDMLDNTAGDMALFNQSPTLLLPARNFTGGLAQQLEGSAATLGRNAARSTRNPEPITPNSSLSSAYAQASRGSSSAMVPISRVYEQVKAQNPALTVPQFLAEVQAADQRGEVLLEPFDSPQGLQAAGEFTVRNASGVPSINMAVTSPSLPVSPSPSLASPAELKAAQKSNESKLAALGLPVKPGTRIWAAAKMRAALGKIAKDGSYPATMRAMADLLTRVNLDNLLLKVEADARLNFAGKYQPYNDGRGEISLNTRVTGRGDTDIVQSLVHELLHHATYRALRSPKNATQKGAIADLEALRKRALAALSAQEQGRQFDYELSNTDEFIAALFTRADFQTALAGIPADSAPKSLTQRVRSVLDEIFRVLGELVTGRKVEPGSVLEASFSATLRLMGQTAAAGGMTNGEGRMTNDAALLNPAAPAPNETRSRFASPNAADRVINGPRTDAQVADEARAWLGSVDQQTAIEAFASQAVPLPLDAQEHAAAVLIKDLSEQAAKGGTEVQRMWAHVQGQRMARIWTKEFLSADPARALRQRGVVNNTILQPIAPILAAQETLIDRAEAVGKTRFDGGWEGLVQKINDLLKRIENLVAGTAAEKIAKGDSTPSLKTLLNNLRRKMYPGMDWTEIFTDLPSSQKQRQFAIYERLMKDERLQGLTPQERLDLTNELDKAWQRERREVFKRELRKAGILGEKDAGDRVKVTNAMPKLLRLVNLGMFNSAMFREVIAPQYGLKVIDSTTAARLRGMAEAAYAQPEGVLRNRKLGELLNAMQSATGSTLAELVNSYWTAAVLSGTRTQWDTWMAFTNGMGTNLLQAAGLLARGRGKDAVAAHAAWWRGLLDGMRESLQILAKGDYSVLKRFGTDLNKALQGESGFRPVPLGESLWQNGNTWQKYFMAPVMIWTGRLMAAADHVNNTATTAGAMAVARALHPEFYGRTTFSATDRANARAQALREVTGGAEPVTAADKATVSVRVRELLYGSMREPERLEANEIGDMAAFQNDPTGIFGTIYAAMKAGLGTVQRGLEDYAQDMQASQWTRAAAGLMAGSLHGLTGTRFMRFGFNFGAELTRYVPGTALLDKTFKGAVYGRDAGPMQRELLLGKNVIGLMLGSTLAALFLNRDDDDEGWQIEGDWSGLTPQQVKERMSAGLERMTMWKRDGDTVRRVSYKQWPTMGLFAVVGGMLDEKRHKPAQWAQHGPAGHLGRALGTGMLQIKNVSAMRNLVELFGGTRFAGDPSTGIIDDVVKTATNFAGGFVPTALKDAEIWQAPRNFKAEGWLEELQRSTPIARRFVNDGRPQLNLLGEEVKLQRAPWSRTITSVESSEASRVLGALLGRGLNLPQPSDAVHVVQNGVKVPLETLGREKVWQYEKAVGTAYKQWLAAEGTTLLQMPVKQAAKVIEQRAASIKRQALARVVR